jgi:hypothetical protein
MLSLGRVGANRKEDEIAMINKRAMRANSILFGRGYAHAALGEWKEAAADFQFVQSPFAETTPEMWIDDAVVLLKLENASASANMCRGMLNKFNSPQDG